ncbi:cyclic AMP-dependent transcription factor ATF-4 [Ascaphus truei]|uniref:cyclic AMP-dependent transcription factor ATF-4 n=1 Tax=Ascaphus truei TaxID=8439 RepID=UPI003F59885B
MSLLSNEIMLGHLLSPFNQPFLAAEESLGLLDDCIEMPGYLPSHGFSINKSKDGISDLLPLVDSLGSFKEDAFSGMDWMVEKMDLKEFDFHSLFGMEDLESTVLSDELMATLEDSCDLIEDPHFPLVLGITVPSPDLISLPQSPLEDDQVAPLSPDLSESRLSSPDHSFSLDLGSEVDVAEEDKKPPATYVLEIIKCEKEDSSDNDSGISLSPLSYLESPQQSPTFTVEYPSSIQSSPASPISERPKPYHLPSKDKAVLSKIKVAGGEPKPDKKKKKMEQNKTAATRYRQKKRAEQDAISGECRELEDKNNTLSEKLDSLAKEVQYLKDLMEEVRKAKIKRAKSS